METIRSGRFAMLTDLSWKSVTVTGNEAAGEGVAAPLAAGIEEGGVPPQAARTMRRNAKKGRRIGIPFLAKAEGPALHPKATRLCAACASRGRGRAGISPAS